MIFFVGLKPSPHLKRVLAARSVSWQILASEKELTKGSFIVCASDKVQQMEKALQRAPSRAGFLLTAVTSQADALSGDWIVLQKSSWEQSLIQFIPFFKQWLSLLSQSNQSERQLQNLLQKTNHLVEQFQKDLDFASSIQRTLLPTSEIIIPGISLTTKYIPADGLGGDYFDVFELSDKRHLGILVADSQTHGMAAALLSVLLKMHVDEFKALASSSKSLVEHLNRALYQIHLSKLPGLHFIFGILDRSTLSFEFTAAGNLKPLLFSRMGLKALTGQSTSNPPLGLSPDVHFSTEFLQLKPGDLLFLHTDGLVQAFQRKEEVLLKELEGIFRSTETVDPFHYQSELLAKLNKLKEEHSELPDDVTFIQLFIDQKALYLAQSK